MLIFRGVEYEVFPKLLENFLTFQFSSVLEASLFSKCLTSLFKKEKKFRSRHGVVFDVVELFTTSH